MEQANEMCWKCQKLKILCKYLAVDMKCSVCKGIVASCLLIIDKWNEDLKTQYKYTCLQNKKNLQRNDALKCFSQTVVRKVGRETTESHHLSNCMKISGSKM
jgi:hypothetical protein